MTNVAPTSVTRPRLQTSTHVERLKPAFLILRAVSLGFNDELAALFSRAGRSCCRCIIKFHLTSFIAANVPVKRDVRGHNYDLFGPFTESFASLFLPFKWLQMRTGFILETLVRIPRLFLTFWSVFRPKVFLYRLSGSRIGAFL